MSDYRRQHGPEDAFIDFDRPANIRYWTEELDVDENTLRELVAEVGPKVDDIVAHLVSRQSGGEHPRPPAG
jgi:hypothetical protein